ncbi:kinase-like domain-containing protein [Lineolata rhizophorae]|uniref:Kinase-like domain-containing protein n=1 Tax=Lineolata rhizophorae TaxID=578093 RepID=A0A6A6PBC5_9PEZI|nr:kinase-like domain-containing protein [Lineolata rhizophorae]
MDHPKDLTPASKPSRNRVTKASCNTVAARWNLKILRALESTLKKDPEADIARLLPSTYSGQLQSLKSPETKPKPSFPSNDIRSRLDATAQSAIIFDLSSELEDLRSGRDLSEALVDSLAEGEVLYESAWAASVMVFRISENIVVKVTDEASAMTEHRTLSYLRERLPDFPAPRPHGVVRLDTYFLLFSTFIQGVDLEKVWPQLDEGQKLAVSSQLDSLFSQLRALPFPDDTPLGGIQGDGCKDCRRGVRVSSEAIMDVGQFEDFIFAGLNAASSLYADFLRSLMPLSSVCVFTHGDLRPANIIVDTGDDGTWKVVAVIDWESSGFYPEYWECVKMTNNLTPRDQFDWYRYLPKSLAPHRYAIQWLVDRLRDRSMVNS